MTEKLEEKERKIQQYEKCMRAGKTKLTKNVFD